MLPCTADLFSSAVPELRLPDANFGTAALSSANENRPLGPNMRKPSLAPFWTVAFGALTDPRIQSATSWLFSTLAFGWPVAPSASRASPRPATAEMASMLRRFMTTSLCGGCEMRECASPHGQMAVGASKLELQWSIESTMPADGMIAAAKRNSARSFGSSVTTVTQSTLARKGYQSGLRSSARTDHCRALDSRVSGNSEQGRL